MRTENNVINCELQIFRKIVSEKGFLQYGINEDGEEVFSITTRGLREADKFLEEVLLTSKNLEVLEEAKVSRIICNVLGRHSPLHCLSTDFNRWYKTVKNDSKEG